MGSLYRPKFRASDGSLRESRIWWVKYRLDGRVIRESSGTDREGEARRLLRQREGAALEGRAIVPRVERVKVADLAEDLRQDYAANGRRSSERMEFCLEHILAFFGERRAVQVTVADANAYEVRRHAEGAANATINRELCALKRMYSLALVAERIHRAPRIPRLEERNVRQGFFEREQFEALRRYLPEALRAVVTFAYITGWRTRSEILPLQWRQVDFKAGTVRLEPETTKNREGRTFVMTPELRAALEEQRAGTEALQRRTGRIIPWVFHRNGRPIKWFRQVWRSACKKAGVPGRIPHDFRRSAVRNMERAGVPRSVAMKLVGHKTEAIYRRYAIVDEAMLREGAERLARAEQGKVGKVERE
ncbi:MAG: site-specific integrase [Candidatus Rokubacteria bacterium]|nr:site-specific integrase [Candidatus Rokubacteria bacterium]